LPPTLLTRPRLQIRTDTSTEPFELFFPSCF
jgi:hypothetical protein